MPSLAHFIVGFNLIAAIAVICVTVKIKLDAKHQGR
jgi:hypothetical protein